ncbi:MAG: glycosyltransferase family 9 protein [Candidatus Firestonebacteria bacterium]
MLKFIFKTAPKALERAIKNAVFGLLSFFFEHPKKVEPLTDPHKILIIFPENALGDLLSKTALLTTLKASFPGAAIDVVAVRKTNRMVLEHNPLIRHIYFREIDRSSKLVFSLRFLGLVLKLRRERYDLAVTPSSDNLRYALFCGLTGAKRCVGFSSEKSKFKRFEAFLTDTYPEDNLHFVEKNQKLGAYIAGEKAVVKNPALFLTDEELAYAEKFWKTAGVDGGDVVVGVHPLFGEHIERRYSAENFGKVYGLIREAVPKAKLAVFWGPTEKENMPALIKLAAGNIIIEDVNFRKLAALLRRPDVYICCNTGTSHLASLADVPVILLCEPKLLHEFDPWGTKGNVIRTETALCDNIKPQEIASLGVQLLRKYSPGKL